MTPTQLKALQSYVEAVVRVMTDHMGAHASNVQLYVAARDKLERAFGQQFPDLLPSTAVPQQPAFPDIL